MREDQQTLQKQLKEKQDFLGLVVATYGKRKGLGTLLTSEEGLSKVV